MLAALTAAQKGASVTLLERNQKVGRKLYITGKGRCNLTNDCSVQEVLANIPRNSQRRHPFSTFRGKGAFFQLGCSAEDGAGQSGFSAVG